MTAIHVFTCFLRHEIKIDEPGLVQIASVTVLKISPCLDRGDSKGLEYHCQSTFARETCARLASQHELLQKATCYSKVHF